MTINEQTIIDSLRRVPFERWGDVLHFIESLAEPEPAIQTAADLSRSGLIGTWADRDDLGSSREFARQLRRQAEAGYGRDGTVTL